MPPLRFRDWDSAEFYLVVVDIGPRTARSGSPRIPEHTNGFAGVTHHPASSYGPIGVQHTRRWHEVVTVGRRQPFQVGENHGVMV